MKIEVTAFPRSTQGTGASRRLRHTGRVPGIVYGGKQAPESIELDHASLVQQMRKEAFHASVLDMTVGEAKYQVLLRDYQMHPVRPQIQHVDFQRIAADEKIHMKVPLHFINEASSPGVKINHGSVSHITTELQVQCLPADLPEYIEVDLGNMDVGDSVHATGLKLPAGVELVPRLRKDDPVIVSVQVPRAGAVEEATPVAAAAATTEITGQKPPVEGEKKDAGKKDAGKK